MTEREEEGTHEIFAEELLLARLTRQYESTGLGRRGRRVRLLARLLLAVDAVLADGLVRGLARQRSDGSVRLSRLLLLELLLVTRGASLESERRVESGSTTVEPSSTCSVRPVDLLTLHRCERLRLSHRLGLSLREHGGVELLSSKLSHRVLYTQYRQLPHSVSQQQSTTTHLESIVVLVH